MNFFSTVVIWGWLLGFYLNVIYETAFGEEQLPEIFLGGNVSFIWNIIKPILIFSLTMLFVQLPFIAALSLLQGKGVDYMNMWHGYSGFNPLLQVLFIGGLFFFPISILTTAIGKDFTLLRPDYLLRAVFKAFAPYLLIVALLVAGCLVNNLTKQFVYDQEISTALHIGRFALNIVVQIVLIIAMRSIGLFYRHYSCHLGW